ncbi:hypothetical protein SDC9_194078 [bioreactor metagenome]|uniref:Uncharacterized protein n=1 Tax=bioreactor metagenome TaxID=1076179 RepID=A0A645I6R7_9ZZZZ
MRRRRGFQFLLEGGTRVCVFHVQRFLADEMFEVIRIVELPSGGEFPHFGGEVAGFDL